MAGINIFDSKECEWIDLQVYLAGAFLIKLRGIKYKSKKSKELYHAGGDEPHSIQSGNREYEGEIKIGKNALDSLNRAAIAAGGTDCLDLSFDVVVKWAAKGSRTMAIDTLVGVEITEYEIGMDQGAKFMDVTLPIMFLRKKSA